MDLDSFHPAVRTWFERRFAGPTEAQARGWPEIMAGRDTLIAAPTGSGKTLAAFLVAIDRLLRRAESASGGLEDGIEVVYISPLKALSSDIRRNLEEPLKEITQIALEMGYASPNIRAMVRTGDTTSKERQEIVRRPPHILITTPESLYLMLTAERSREVLRRTKTVIVDEIHALIRDKRGSHLSLSLARLDHICAERPSRIGLSATIRPIEQAARFLVGSEAPDCTIVDAGHQRDLDIAIDVPPTDLEAVCSGQQWGDIYDRLATLIKEHRTTLIFVNTRRLAERAAHNLAERLGEEHVASHHGSLSKERRQGLEERLKAGDLKALVATASLELGIDIGVVDLVCQLESPRSITTFLQRVGRSGHALGLTPKGRLFPTSRDELVECAALLRAVRAGRLDCVFPPVAPLDILAQQIVAECACEPWREDDLYDLMRKAAPYADLERRDFDEVVEMMSEGIVVGMGRAAAYLHRDRINRVLRGKRGARMTAIESGGAIPDVADYRVLAEPDGAFVGTLDEDFAIESMAGDIILLGTTSWRIRRIESGVVRVEDAHGLPPTVPFWLGEAPARTAELSDEISALRRDIVGWIEGGGDATRQLEEIGLPAPAAEQVVRYVRIQHEAMGVVPSSDDIVFERFFDDSGGMQLVVHAPFGGRINRGLGLALRKNFCRTFDFELQAAASDDAVLLSIGPQHSFPLEDMFSLVRAATVEYTITQALLTVPMFTTRWRWNATRALAIIRQRGGKRTPPPLQRMRSDDLMASVFPRLVACQENVTGDIELPDHPLIRQTVHDCLHEAIDIDGLRDVLERVERGEIRLHARDTTEPSPFAHEILTSKPYTFLDNAPLEERRARAITLRRTLPESARDLGELDAEAIERVRDEARPQPRDAEELHDALLGLLAVRAEDAAGWSAWFDELVAAHRAAVVETGDGERLWFAAEQLRLVERLYPGATIMPQLRLPPELDRTEVDEEEALLTLLRGHVECLGPLTVAELAQRTAQPSGRVASGLARLEGEGVVLRGHFRKGVEDEEFCDRRLLARIHRYTLDRLRREIEPVSAQDFLRFLLRWQHVAPGTQLEGKRGLLEALTQLQGFEAPAVAWERHILPHRVAGYRSSWLDELCLSGDAAWARLSVRPRRAPVGRTSEGNGNGAAASSSTLISLARRGDLPWLMNGIRNGDVPSVPSRGAAHEILDLLRERGALFYADIVSGCRRLPTDVERGLWELVASGLVTADGFQALRSLMGSARRRSTRSARSAQRGRSLTVGVAAGRWALLPSPDGEPQPVEELAEAWAEQLLFRYGVIFRDLVQRESISVPWREVLRALRRLEARGLVRGGRFVAGFYGEQYARPEAVESLRRVRRMEPEDEQVLVSAVDPLNLAGILTPAPRIPAIHTNVVVYRDGLPSPATNGSATGSKSRNGDRRATARSRLVDGSRTA
ncbi:MAG: DEAD/DEAH box helicase [Chloroflexi bacterium]|nr:DEAD/DEAH box helicase [Chloroflexota bacterium]